MHISGAECPIRARFRLSTVTACLACIFLFVLAQKIYKRRMSLKTSWKLGLFSKKIDSGSGKK